MTITAMTLISMSPQERSDLESVTKTLDGILAVLGQAAETDRLTHLHESRLDDWIASEEA